MSSRSMPRSHGGQASDGRRSAGKPRLAPSRESQHDVLATSRDELTLDGSWTVSDSEGGSSQATLNSPQELDIKEITRQKEKETERGQREEKEEEEKRKSKKKIGEKGQREEDKKNVRGTMVTAIKTTTTPMIAENKGQALNQSQDQNTVQIQNRKPTLNPIEQKQRIKQIDQSTPSSTQEEHAGSAGEPSLEEPRLASRRPKEHRQQRFHSIAANAASKPKQPEATNSPILENRPHRKVEYSTTATIPPITQILFIANARGRLSMLNDISKLRGANAIVHVGDFGFCETDSSKDGSELDDFLKGRKRFDIPVYAIFGPKDNLSVVQKFQNRTYQVPNLHLLDHRHSYSISAGKDVFLLLGLGGAVHHTRLFDVGRGSSMVAGTEDDLWVNMLQIDELLQLTRRHGHEDERIVQHRILLVNDSPSKEPLLHFLASALNADYTISSVTDADQCCLYTDRTVYTPSSLDVYLRPMANKISALWSQALRGAGRYIKEYQKAACEHVVELLERRILAGQHDLNICHLALADLDHGCAIFSNNEGKVMVDVHSGRSINLPDGRQITNSPFGTSKGRTILGGSSSPGPTSELRQRPTPRPLQEPLAESDRQVQKRLFFIDKQGDHHNSGYQPALKNSERSKVRNDADADAC